MESPHPQTHYESDAPGAPHHLAHCFCGYKWYCGDMSFSITTWNVNSVRKRLDGLSALIEEEAPDVICLQETKVQDHLFPAEEISNMGYPHQAITGMKGYNGVAILSKVPLVDPQIQNWCEREDCRHIFAGLNAGPRIGEIELHSLYVPAGGDKPDPLKNPKFAHKLNFLDEQSHWWAARGCATQTDGGPLRVIVGDFNIAPLPSDVWSHQRMKNTITHTEIEIKALEMFRKSGHWVDAMRKLIPEKTHLYTWWSYRAADWETVNKGRRLDHIWVSENLADNLERISILKDARDWQPPSDHVPVTLYLKS
jgi:exodeoxyribonuclease-3